MAVRKKSKRVRKKKPQSKRARSQAAKKGWAKRKARERASRAIKAHPQLEGIDEQLQEAYLTGLEQGRKEGIKKRVERLVKKGLIGKDKDEIVMARLIAANAEGRFDEETFEISEEFDGEYSRGELYEMFFSPK